MGGFILARRVSSPIRYRYSLIKLTSYSDVTFTSRLISCLVSCQATNIINAFTKIICKCLWKIAFNNRVITRVIDGNSIPWYVGCLGWSWCVVRTGSGTLGKWRALGIWRIQNGKVMKKSQCRVQTTGLKCYQSCQKFQNYWMSILYLESPWEIHSIKYQHV